MKRASDRQITKDDAEAGVLDADTPSEGSFQKATPDVLAKRRIVKARRSFTADPNGNNDDNDNNKPNAFAVLGSNNSTLPSNAGSGTANDIEKAPQQPPDAPVTSQPAETQRNAEVTTNVSVKQNSPKERTEDQVVLTGNMTRADAPPADDVAKLHPLASDQAKKLGEGDAQKVAEPGTQQPVDISDAKPLSEMQKTKTAEEGEDTKRADDTKKTEAVENSKASEKPAAEKPAAEKPVMEKPATEKPANDVESKEGPNVSETAATAVSQAEVSKEAVRPNGATFKVPVFGGLTGSAPLTFANAAAADTGSFDVKSTAPAPKSAPTREFKEAHVETGEEDEQELFRSRAKLYSLESAEAGPRWKERGVGMLKLNLHTERKSARLLMRTEATLRVILNTPVYTGMKFDKATERSLRFLGFEEDDKEEKKATTFLVRFTTRDVASELVTAVENLEKKNGEE